MSFTSYCNGFQAVPKLGLERISDLLARLGHPEKQLSCVHVAGTNGKGSVCMFLDAILRKEGLKVGRYLSPNLKKVNERISVNGEEISDSDLSRILKHLESLSSETEKAVGLPPTPFEVWTAAAFLYFQEQKCDIVILEVGMGGLYDATNVITAPKVSVITRLDLDHTAYLGNTLGEIAFNKCGIMKENCPTVALSQDREAMEVIRETAKTKHCPLTEAVPPSPVAFTGITETFRYPGFPDVTLSLGGVHQLENASLAVETAKVLHISRESILYGLAHAKHPARLEILSENPTVIFDGGHNPNGITALVTALNRYFPEEEETVVFACMADKEIETSLKLLQNGKRRFVFTTVQNNERAMPANTLQEKARSFSVPGEARPNLKEAIALAKSYGKPVIVCGSLYLYGDL